MNNSAQLGNIVLMGVILIGVAISVILAHIILVNFTASSGDLITEPVAREILTKGGNAWSVWDYGFLILTIGTFIALIVSATMIRTSPIFFFIMLLALALELFMIPSITNIFMGFTEASAINDTVVVETSYPFIFSIMKFLPFISAFAVIVFLILFFGKPYGSGNNEY